jgi:hypothetical protein
MAIPYFSIIELRTTIRCDHFVVYDSPNSQWAFFEVLEEACNSGYLRNGDFLVMDNASIHDAIDSWDLVELLLSKHGMPFI